MNGKGDTPRPVDGQKYREGWERIFARNKFKVEFAEEEWRWDKRISPAKKSKRKK